KGTACDSRVRIEPFQSLAAPFPTRSGRVSGELGDGRSGVQRTRIGHSRPLVLQYRSVCLCSDYHYPQRRVEAAGGDTLGRSHVVAEARAVRRKPYHYWRATGESGAAPARAGEII